MSKKNIVIIGQGEIGRAIHHLLKKTANHIEIECWDVDVKACPNRKPLEKTVPFADYLFLCIPSWTIRVAAEDLKHLIKPNTIIVTLSKGLDRTSGKSVDELLKEVFPKKAKTALMSGPMLAEEIMKNKSAAAIIASSSSEVQKDLIHLFKPTKLFVVAGTDLRGTALCGILKNIYALGFGIAQELHAGDNYRGMYTYSAIHEMEQIIKKLKGDEKTVCGYAGIGDFIATGFSKHSKNNEFGKTLAKKGSVPFDSEGSVSIRPIAEKIGAFHKKLPVFNTIYRILVDRESPKIILDIFEQK